MSDGLGSDESITQYGVRTSNSGVILVVTTDRAEAERALEWIAGGHIVRRTITLGCWQGVGDAGDIALAG